MPSAERGRVRLNFTVDEILKRAIASHKAGEVVEADRLYSKILRVQPTHAEANHNLGVLAVDVGKTDKAIPFLKAALKSNSKIDQFWFSYVDTLIKLNKFADAKIAITKARDLGINGKQLDASLQKILIHEAEVHNLRKNTVDNRKKALDPPEKEFAELITLYNQQKYDRLKSQTEKLTKVYKNSASLHNILGATLHAQNKLWKAEKAYKVALKINPNAYETWNNLGNVLRELKKFKPALTAYRRSASLSPSFSIALYNMGYVLCDLQKLDDAIKAFTKAIEVNPYYVEAYNTLGQVLLQKGVLDDAMNATAKAIELNPKFAQAHNNLSNIYRMKGQFSDAIQSAKNAISIQPKFPEAYCSLALVLKELELHEEAINQCKVAITLNPEYAVAYNNLGNLYKDIGDPKLALEMFSKAIALQPQYADAIVNSGNALTDIGKYNEAIEEYKRALKINPNHSDAKFNASFAYLNNKDISLGLQMNEWRWLTKGFAGQKRDFKQSILKPSSTTFNKRLLIWSEQGIGDTINWVSYLPRITELCQSCTLECQKKLVPLLTRSFPNIKVIPTDIELDTKRTDFDLHLPLGSLPYYFHINHIKYTRQQSYLHANAEKELKIREKLNTLGPAPFVGISWRSLSMLQKRSKNYAPIADWAPLAQLENVTFINLQATATSGELHEMSNVLGKLIHSFDDIDLHNDIDGSAALIGALDTVISIKTTTALISSAMGTPTLLANLAQSQWNNFLYNPVGTNLKIIEKSTFDPWADTFCKIVIELENYTKKSKWR